MRIGLLSDTHVPSSTREMPYQVAKAFAGVDLIFHCGDVYASSVFEWLQEIAPVYSVDGGLDQATAESRMAQRHILKLEGVQVGMIHALNLPDMYSEVWPGAIEEHFPKHASVREAVRKTFGQTFDIDVVVFGDTHYETLERHDGVLFINPGSPTLPRQLRKLGTVGILELKDGRAEGQILDLNQFSVAGRPNVPYI